MWRSTRALQVVTMVKKQDADGTGDHDDRKSIAEEGSPEASPEAISTGVPEEQLSAVPHLTTRVTAASPFHKEWWEFFDAYSTPDLPLSVDQHNHPKVKLASENSFQDACTALENVIRKEYKSSRSGTPTAKTRTPLVFSASVGGGDDVLSLYASTVRAQPEDAAMPVLGLFHDVSDWKLDYLAARAYIAAASATPADYLDTILMTSSHYGADPAESLHEQLTAISRSKKGAPLTETHKRHVMDRIGRLPLVPEERARIEHSVDRLVQLLHWARDNKLVNYRNFAKELDDNLVINGAGNGSSSHWLLSGLDTIRQAVLDGNLRFVQLDIDSDAGRARYDEILTAATIPKKNRSVLALHQASEKFKRAEKVARSYAHFVTTHPSEEPGIEREWKVDTPERIYHPRSIEDTLGGALTIEELEELRRARELCIEKTLQPEHGSRFLVLGDILIGSPAYTEGARKVLKYAAKVSREQNTDAILLLGSPFAGVPRTKKQHRGTFFAQGEFRDVYAQLEEAARVLSSFKGKRYAVATDEVAAWVEHVFNAEFRDKLEEIRKRGFSKHYQYDELSPMQQRELGDRLQREAEYIVGETDEENGPGGDKDLELTLLSEYVDGPYTNADDIIAEKIDDIKRHGIEMHFLWKNLSVRQKEEMRNRLWTEMYFKAVNDCYEAITSELDLDTPLVDRLKLKFNNILVDLQHKRESQYFSLHTGPGTVRKDQKLHNQKAARSRGRTGLDNELLLTAHDLDLRSQVHDPLSMQLSVLSATDINGLMALPEENRRDLWSQLYKSVAVKGKLPDFGATVVEYTEDGRYLITPIISDFLSKIVTNPNVPEVRRSIVSTGDWQCGSLANKHAARFQVAGLDYAFHELPKRNAGKDWGIVLWHGGDLVEGQNYAKAPLRNVVPQINEQVEVFLRMISPYVETCDDRGHLIVNPLIRQMPICTGNHEMNSARRESTDYATDQIYQYYRGMLRSQLGGDDAKVEAMMRYGKLNVIQRNGHTEELFDMMCASAEVCGYPIFGSHVFQTGHPNGGDFIAPIEAWIDRAGAAAKDNLVYLQWHYHSFGLGTHAGKLLVSLPAPVGLSDFEYQRGLSPKYQQAILHLSNKAMPTIELLTSRFFENYGLQNPLFKNVSPEEYARAVESKAHEAVPLGRIIV